MAKKITKTGQTCPTCSGRTPAVFEEPTKKTSGAFWYGLHDRPAGGRCPRSNVQVSIARWPTWALKANEKAQDALDRRRR